MFDKELRHTKIKMNCRNVRKRLTSERIVQILVVVQLYFLFVVIGKVHIKEKKRIHKKIAVQILPGQAVSIKHTVGDV